MWKSQWPRASTCTPAPTVLHPGQSSTSIAAVPRQLLLPRLEQLDWAEDARLPAGPRTRSCQRLPAR